VHLPQQDRDRREIAFLPVRCTSPCFNRRYTGVSPNPGERHRLVAIARSILVIVWHLLTDRAARYRNLGSSYHASRIDQNRKMRNHVRQLEALGYTVNLTQAA